MHTCILCLQIFGYLFLLLHKKFAKTLKKKYSLSKLTLNVQKQHWFLTLKLMRNRFDIIFLICLVKSGWFSNHFCCIRRWPVPVTEWLPWYLARSKIPILPKRALRSIIFFVVLIIHIKTVCNLESGNCYKDFFPLGTFSMFIFTAILLPSELFVSQWSL